MAQPLVEKMQTLIHHIHQERIEDGLSRSNLDKKGLRARRTEIFELLESAGPLLRVRDARGETREDPSLLERHEIFTGVLHHAFDSLSLSIDQAHHQFPVQQRYSPEAHDSARALYKEFSSTRSKVNKRLGRSELDAHIRTLCSVGEQTSWESPLNVRDLSARMLNALRDPDHAERFAHRGLDAEALSNLVQAGLDKLDREIARGPGERRAEGSNLVLEALLFLEITFSRLLIFLDDYGASEIARRIRDAIPRRHQRRKRAVEEETRLGVVGGEEGFGGA